MNEMNPLETRLRSWQPRRPSAGLRNRIFTAPPAAQWVPAWWVRALAPAAACLFLALGMIQQSDTLTRGSGRDAFLAGLIPSNRPIYVPDHYQSEQNSYPQVTFGWTNQSGSTSVIGSVQPGRVN
jgi:hypothetical protein